MRTMVQSPGRTLCLTFCIQLLISVHGPAAEVAPSPFLPQASTWDSGSSNGQLKKPPGRSWPAIDLHHSTCTWHWAPGSWMEWGLRWAELPREEALAPHLGCRHKAPVRQVCQAGRASANLRLQGTRPPQAGPCGPLSHSPEMPGRAPPLLDHRQLLEDFCLPKVQRAPASPGVSRCVWGPLK